MRIKGRVHNAYCGSRRGDPVELRLSGRKSELCRWYSLDLISLMQSAAIFIS